MGGKETEKAGVLIYNIYTSSWTKDDSIRFQEATYFQQWEAVDTLEELNVLGPITRRAHFG